MYIDAASVSSTRLTRQRVYAFGIAAAIVASVLLLSGCGGSQAQGGGMPPPPAVSVTPVLAKEVAQWDEYTGRIDAVDSVDLRPRVSGYIESVNYVEGQDVKKGDVLFTIDSRSYRADLARAEAALTRARSQAAQSQSESARAQGLSSQQAISEEVFEQRRAAAAVAQADVQAAQAALATARLNLEWTQVRAPISGRAGRAMVTAGNLVSASDTASVLTTLVSENKVYVYFDTDEGAFLHYAGLARGKLRPSELSSALPVQVALSNEQGFPHTGNVDFVDNRLDRSTGSIRVRAVLDNRDRVFTAGLFARVRLLGNDRVKALLVDERAVLTDQDRNYVYIVDGDGKAQRRDIQLGRSAEGLRIVEKGLVAGDKVIVSGVQKIFMPGMPVSAQTVTADAPNAAAVALK